MASRRAFPIPNYTQVPNMILDEAMYQLTRAEVFCLLYVVRHTFGYHRKNRGIPLRQFCEGYVGRSGELSDHGTGLDISSVKRALASLEDAGFIARTRRYRKDGGYAPTVYTLVVNGMPTLQDDDDEDE